MKRKHKNTYIFAPERQTHHVRGFFLWLLILLLIGVATVFTMNFVRNHQVNVTQETVTVLNLPGDIENWSILHLSDLHGRELGDQQSEIRKAIALKNYSCVVMTGDMVGVDGDVQPLLDLIALLPKDVPKLLLAGDSDPAMLDAKAHGSLSVFSDWAQQVKDAGVLLLDEPIQLTRGKGSIWFVPEYFYSLDLDSMQSAYQGQLDGLNAQAASLTADQAAQKRVAEYQLEKILRLRDIKKNMTGKDVQVAVTHTPLTADYVATMLQWQGKDEYFSLRYVSLILAGHYVGGQWRLPWGGAIYVPDFGWWPEDRLIMGMNYIHGIPQHISVGLSASDCYPFQPSRFFNSPGVTLIYLTARVV